MPHEHVMSTMDQELAHALKNEFLELCLSRKASSLVALSAARCAAECFESIINEQGGEVFTVNAPSDFEQLIRLQEVAAKAQAFLGAINTDIQTEPRPRCEILEISESAGDGGSYNHALLDTVELMETVSALREALTHTGGES